MKEPLSQKIDCEDVRKYLFEPLSIGENLNVYTGDHGGRGYIFWEGLPTTNEESNYSLSSWLEMEFLDGGWSDADVSITRINEFEFEARGGICLKAPDYHDDTKYIKMSDVFDDNLLIDIFGFTDADFGFFEGGIDYCWESNKAIGEITACSKTFFLMDKEQENEKKVKVSKSIKKLLKNKFDTLVRDFYEPEGYQLESFNITIDELVEIETLLGYVRLKRFHL